MKKLLIALLATTGVGLALADTFTVVSPKGGFQSAPGYYCVTTGNTVTCAQAQANYYAAAGATSQTRCPTGYTSQPGATFCVQKTGKEN
jgi:hypothetical protein